MGSRDTPRAELLLGEILDRLLEADSTWTQGVAPVADSGRMLRRATRQGLSQVASSQSLRYRSALKRGAGETMGKGEMGSGGGRGKERARGEKEGWEGGRE